MRLFYAIRFSNPVFFSAPSECAKYFDLGEKEKLMMLSHNCYGF